MVHDKLFPPQPKGERIHVLGEAAFRGRVQRFGLLPDDRLRHLWVLGKTGSGKSTLLHNLIVQDLRAGEGLAVLDPHGDLVRGVLPHVPRHRTNEVLLFDPDGREHPISFNVFRQGRRLHPDIPLLASQLIAVFRKQWSAFWGPRLEHVLRNGILAVASLPEASLLTLYRFLTDQTLREKLIARVEDPLVVRFWTHEFPSYKASLQAEALSPVLNKLGAFVGSPVVRNIVGQLRSRMEPGRLMDEKQVLLADLATGAVGEDVSHLLGGLLLAVLQLGAMSRPRGGPAFYVYVDEFQNFVNDSLASLLAESRKFGLGLTLAHQYLAQLPLGLRDAVLGNAGSAVVFRLGATDADVLEAEFNPPFTSHDLQGLPPFHATTRVLARGRALDPLLARMLPPVGGGDPQVAARVREQSRRHLARPRGEVEAEIARILL